MTDEALLETVEAFFGVPDVRYSSVRFDDERSVRVLTFLDAPWEGIRAHVAFDSVHVAFEGLLPKRRVFPVLPVDDDRDGALQVAHAFSWARTKNVVPCPKEVILGLGHSPELPHLRYDHPFPWEHEGPAELVVGELLVVPVLAYSITDAEARFQHQRGAKALDEILEGRLVPLFQRDRGCSVSTATA
jgi:hypothetical protein